MRLVIAQKPLRQFLRWIQRALSAGALMMLGYCGFVLVDGWMFQNWERRHFEQLLNDRQTTSGARNRRAPRSSPGVLPIAGKEGLIGRIEIPRLGLSAFVIEGTSATTLRRAVGHIPGTALPGQPGNVGISGHRDTFFRPLRNIQRNDVITLTTLLGEYSYRVVSTKVVSPYDVTVLDPSGNENLTLVTCYPFYFVGPAPKRFIVRAIRAT